MTKVYEEVYRGTLSEVLGQLGEEEVKGEVTVILEGCTSSPPADTSSIRDALKHYSREMGLSMKEVVDRVAGDAEQPHTVDWVFKNRAVKLSVPVEGASPALLKRYAEACGLTLARAHAKSGDAATISGYLGRSDAFDQAIGMFALAYADQNERDHAKLVAAVKAGRVEALVEADL